jgi:hypothetical protein
MRLYVWFISLSVTVDCSLYPTLLLLSYALYCSERVQAGKRSIAKGSWASPYLEPSIIIPFMFDFPEKQQIEVHYDII